VPVFKSPADLRAVIHALPRSQAARAGNFRREPPRFSTPHVIPEQPEPPTSFIPTSLLRPNDVVGRQAVESPPRLGPDEQACARQHAHLQPRGHRRMGGTRSHPEWFTTSRPNRTAAPRVAYCGVSSTKRRAWETSIRRALAYVSGRPESCALL